MKSTRIAYLMIALAAATGALTLLGGAAPAGSTPAATGQFKMLKTIPTGGTGRWDYIWIDAETRRAFIPRSSHVQVVDLEQGKEIGDIPGTNGVHGVALVTDLPGGGLGFASNGRDNAVSVFDLKTYKVTKTIKTGANPDAIIYDPGSKHVMAICHSGGNVSVIDPAALDKDPVSIQVGGTLEYAASDGKGHIFVNVEDKDEVVQIDSKANRVLAHWPLPKETGPTGLAIDNEHHRLYVGGGGNAHNAVVLDSETGKLLANLPAGPGIDGIAFEPTLGVAMTANGGDGTVSVIKEIAPGEFKVVQTVKTISGARTINVDTKLHQALLPCNVSAGNFGLAVVGLETPAK